MNVAIGAGPVAGTPARTRRRTPSRRRLAGREWERACGAARCPLLEDDTGQRTNIQGIDLKQVTGAGNRVLLGLRKARHRGGSARRGAKVVFDGARGSYRRNATHGRLYGWRCRDRCADRQPRCQPDHCLVWQMSTVYRRTPCHLRKSPHPGDDCSRRICGVLLVARVVHL